MIVTEMPESVSRQVIMRFCSLDPSECGKVVAVGVNTIIYCGAKEFAHVAVEKQFETNTLFPIIYQ